MKNELDFKLIKSQHLLSDIASDFGKVFKKNNEYVTLCPFHEDHNPSLWINDMKHGGVFICRSCGASGDIISYISQQKGISSIEAAKYLSGQEVPDGERRKLRIVEYKDPYQDFEIVPLPKDKSIEVNIPVRVWNPVSGKTPKYKPSLVHKYCTPSGDFIGYVVRVDLDNNKKMTPQILWCRNKKHNKENWCHFSMPEPRNPYLIEQLGGSKPVLVVEGEKCADVAKSILDKLDILSWCGGVNGWKKTDWSCLIDRKIILWGDADTAGQKCIYEMAERFHSICKTIKVLNVNEKPKGWDIADAVNDGMSQNDIIDFMRNSKNTFEKDISEENEDKEEPDELVKTLDNEFRVLGYKSNKFYFLRYKTGMIKCLTGQQVMSDSSLIELAPYSTWDNLLPEIKSERKKFKMIGDILIREAEKVFFKEDMVRGRGAWIDKERYLFHCGGELIHNGKRINDEDFNTNNIYKRKENIDIKASPITKEEASKVLKVLQLMRWETEADPMVLAGWIATAPIMGALPWRTHLYLSAPMGSGKSEVLKYVSKFLANACLVIQGNTTEAGIRQALDSDTIPVIFDESEGEDEQKARNVQNILFLARQASTGGTILKGSPSGEVHNFLIKSPFLLASVVNALKSDIDRSRFICIKLKSGGGKNEAKKWKEVVNKMDNFFTPAFCQGLVARAIKMLPIIERNNETFKEVGRDYFGDARMADTYAMIFAGLYMLHSDNEVSVFEALQWIKSQEWIKISHDKNTEDVMKGEDRMIDRILQGFIRTQGGDRSVLELVATARDDDTQFRVELGRAKIAVRKKYIWFGNTSKLIEDWLKGTPWSVGYKGVLKEIEGSKSATMRVGGVPIKVVGVPLSYIFDKDVDNV